MMLFFADVASSLDVVALPLIVVLNACADVLDTGGFTIWVSSRFEVGILFTCVQSFGGERLLGRSLVHVSRLDGCLLVTHVT